MAQDLCKLVFKKNKQKYNKHLSLTPLEHKSLVHDIHSQKIDKDLLNNIISEELVRTKEDLIKRRLSLYSLSQAEDEQSLAKMIQEAGKDLPPV